MAGIAASLLQPLRRGRFRRLAAANGLSLFAEYTQLVGLAGVAFATLHHASAWAAVLLAQALPQGLLLPIGGLAADRYGPRTVVAVTGAAQAVLAAAMAQLAAGRGLAAWVPFAYAALLGALLAFALPAFSAMVADVVPPAETRGANGLLQVVDNLTRFLGPVAAAVVLPQGGGLPFLLAATAWGASAIAALGTMGPPRHRPPPAGASLLGAGLRALRQDPVLSALLPAVAIFALGYADATYVGLPALATLAFGTGPSGTGTLYAASGVGALIGALAVGASRRISRPGTLGVGAAVAAGVAMGLVALAPSPTAALPALVACGAAFSACLVLVLTLVQTRTPEPVRGRVLSLVILGFFGVYPLAYALAAVTADALGPRGIVAAGAACMVVGGVAGLLRPALRAAG